MVFPQYDLIPRHPSEIYEALLEGVALFVLLFALSRGGAIRQRYGTLSGVFLLGYGTARIVAEFFRQPDPFLGYLAFGATMGQLLSIPLVVAGLGLLVWARRPSS
jgi:phosphatidylglycerol:prolipoprotein diacylglycerol transferase